MSDFRDRLVQVFELSTDVTDDDIVRAAMEALEARAGLIGLAERQAYSTPRDGDGWVENAIHDLHADLTDLESYAGTADEVREAIGRPSTGTEHDDLREGIREVVRRYTSVAKALGLTNPSDDDLVKAALEVQEARIDALTEIEMMRSDRHEWEMSDMTRGELRSRVEAALVWTEEVERYSISPIFARNSLGLEVPESGEVVSINHAVRLLSLGFSVVDCDWLTGCNWYVYGTGADPYPRGQAATVEEAKSQCIDAAVEHFVNVLNFAGVEVRDAPDPLTEEQVEAFVQEWLAESYPDLHGASLTACLESNGTWWVGVSTEFGDGWDSPSMTAYVKPNRLSESGWSIEGLY